MSGKTANITQLPSAECQENRSLIMGSKIEPLLSPEEKCCHSQLFHVKETFGGAQFSHTFAREKVCTPANGNRITAQVCCPPSETLASLYYPNVQKYLQMTLLHTHTTQKRT